MAVQGAGAAVVYAVGIAALTNAYPDEQRALALGVLFALANVGTALGPFAGAAWQAGLVGVGSSGRWHCCAR